jgi:hypothetical protein
MSPIKGISEIVMLPRLGKIRLGVKKEGPGGTVYPVPTDHFVCPEEVRKVFGQEPKELRIMFPNEDKEQWASQYYRRYSSSLNLLCKGDGQIATDFSDPSMFKRKQKACDPPTCFYYRCGDCRRVMNLQFLLPDCPGFGVYQLDTSCCRSMFSVNSIVEFTKTLCGRISMIPLSLHLVEMKVDLPGWLGPSYSLRVTCSYSLTEVQKLAQAPAVKALLLPPPDSEAPDDLFCPLPNKPCGEQRDSRNPDEELLNLWAMVKNKIWHSEIQNSQIANWFDKNYHLEVNLLDFEPPKPPAKFTAEMLSALYESIERNAGR